MVRKEPTLDPELAAILAKHGIDSKKVEVDVELKEAGNDAPIETTFRAEGVLYSLDYPLSPRVTKVCKMCGDAFLSNYAAVAYCSNECLARDLRDRYGIIWSPNNRVKKEKWEVRVPPQIIPLQALLAMKTIVAQAEADLGYPLELPVEIKPFSVTYPYFGQKSASSVEDYKLPLSQASSQQSSQAYQEIEFPVASEESLVQSHDALENPEKEAQLEYGSESNQDDPFGDIFSDL